jgi:hypothetical protein
MLNKIEQNYTSTNREALAIVYALHKFKHFFIEKLIYLLCRSHGSCIYGHQTIGV